MSIKRIFSWGFPGGTMVKNPPANAGDTGSSPGPGRAHMPRSSWACAPQLLKPKHLETMLRNKRSHCNVKPASSSKDPTQPKKKEKKEYLVEGDDLMWTNEFRKVFPELRFEQWMAGKKKVKGSNRGVSICKGPVVQDSDIQDTEKRTVCPEHRHV